MIALIGPGNARDHACALRLARDCGERFFRFYLLGDNRVLKNAPWTVPCSGMSLGLVARKVSADGVRLAIVFDPVLLIAGAADFLRAEGLIVVGPGQAAAAMEGSKVEMKHVLALAGVPAPPSVTVTDLDEVGRFLDKEWRDERRFVLKVDRYLADANVRTIVPENRSEAVAAARRQFTSLAAGGFSPTVLMERRIQGLEMSVHVLWDGRDYALLPPVRDYKRVGDGDTGPNTHGAAALASGYGFAPRLEARLRREIIEPVLAAMQRRGLDYPGIVYLGLMIADDVLHVLEVNVRPGNPEILALLGLLESELAALLEACATGTLCSARAIWSKSGYCGAVFALADGYPQRDVFLAVPIHGLDDGRRVRPLLAEGVGWTPEHGYVVASGRVAAAVAIGDSVANVREATLADLATLTFKGKHHRTDLGAGFSEGLGVDPHTVP